MGENPFETHYGIHTIGYLRNAILMIIVIILFVWFLYPLLGNKLFTPSITFLIIILLLFSFYLFLLFFGTIKKWKLVRIMEPLLYFIIFFLIVGYILLGGKVDWRVILILICCVFLGIYWLIFSLKKKKSKKRNF